MKKLIPQVSLLALIALASCGNNNKKTTETQVSGESPSSTAQEAPPAYDPKRGEGKFSAESLTLSDNLDTKLAEGGEAVAGVMCASCHKYTDEKLVGPGWKGVTSRRTPAWIMNFITNPEPMLDKDPEAKAMLEICLVRMPNQNLSDEEARQILEFMRKNDGLN